MPDSKISKDYSQRFARQMLAKHTTRTHFTGQDLLSISDSKQVNLLILWNLKDAWEVEKANLTSPYFDYESEQVATAMKNLMNALSQNIKISREVAGHLVEASVISCLKMIQDPSGWISSQLEKFAKPAIPLPKAKELGKYITHHKAVLDLVIKEADVAATKQVLKGDLTRMLYQNTVQLKAASELLRAELNEILELPKPDAAKEEKPEEESPKTQNLFEQIEAEGSTGEAPDDITVETKEAKVFEAEPEPEVQGEPAPAAAMEEPEPGPVADISPKAEKTKAKAAESTPEPAPDPEKQGAMAAESPEPTQFYQKLQGQGSFYSTLKEKNVKKLSESISMGLKFRFISGLFNNDAGEYQTTLEKLENAGDGKKALGMLQKELLKQHGWSPESDIYLELENVVKRRFQA